MHIIRSVLTFPGVSVEGAVSAVGVPGPEIYGSGLFARADGSIIPNPDIGTTPELSRHRLSFETTHNGESLVGIGIAPDSPFEACTIHFGDGADQLAERLLEHRVSVGNPLVHGFTQSFVDVTLPVSIPALSATSIAWDAVLVGNPHVWGWPLVLELYYGSIPSRATRPTYHARVLVAHDNDGQNSTAYFMLDGRRSAEVQVFSPSNNTMGLRIIRIDGRVQLGEFHPRFDNGENSIIMPIGPFTEDSIAAVPLQQGLNRFVVNSFTTLIGVQLVGEFSMEANNGLYQIYVTAR